VVVEQAFGHVGKNVRCATCFQATCNPSDGSRFQRYEQRGVWCSNAGQRTKKYKLIPEEIFSKQNRTANNGGLAKMLFYDIARQTHSPAAIASMVRGLEDVCQFLHQN